MNGSIMLTDTVLSPENLRGLAKMAATMPRTSGLKRQASSAYSPDKYVVFVYNKIKHKKKILFGLFNCAITQSASFERCKLLLFHFLGR